MRSIVTLLSVLVSMLGAGAVHAGTLSDIEERLVQHVDSHNAEALALLENVVNINSGTMNSDGVREVGRVFAAELEQLGFTTRWAPGDAFERAGHLVAEHSGAGRHLLLIGHLDTVFEPDSPLQRFERLSGHEARGPGAIDMKGGNVIIVYALKALRSVGVLDAMQVTVVLTGDEERPGRPIGTARKALTDVAKKADVAIAFENGDNDPGTAVIARRGASQWRLTIEARPAHSMNLFKADYGAGAIYEAARILEAFYETLAGEPYLTFNPGVILGGTTVDFDKLNARGTAFGKNNIIAEHVVVTGDLRSLSMEQREKAKQVMRDIVDDHRPHAVGIIQFDDGYPPMAPGEGNRRLLAMLDQTSRDIGLGGIVATDPGRAGAADIAFASLSIEECIDGLGLVGSGDHTEDETADLRTLPIQTKRAAVLLYRLSLRTGQ
jgi:glutamate carboxypeptidase